MNRENSIRLAPKERVFRAYNTRIFPKISGYRGAFLIRRNLKRIAVPANGSRRISSEFIRLTDGEVFLPLLTETAVVEAILDDLEEGSSFVDVGAYRGFYTVLAACQGASESYAFEPVEKNAEEIRNNAELNDVGDRVTVESTAVAEKNGVARFKIEPGTGSHLSDMGDKIECISLDEYFPPDFVPDIVKIDVEGSENRVLEGMERILQEQHTVLFVEIHGDDDVTSSLENWGYEVEILETRGGQTFQTLVRASPQ